MLELNKIYCMDNVQGMKQLDNDSVDLVVTSPPYHDFRNYNGFSFDLKNMIIELYRIVKVGGGNCMDSKRRDERLFRKRNVISSSVSVHGRRFWVV